MRGALHFLRIYLLVKRAGSALVFHRWLLKNPLETMQDYFPELLQTLQGLGTEGERQLLKDAAARHPDDARPLLLIAAQFAQEGRFDDAEAAYITALHRQPDFAIARFQLGLLQFSANRPVTACATWAPLDALAPSAALRLFKTGMVHLAIDEFTIASSLLQRGIAENRDNAVLNQVMQRLVNDISRLQGSQETQAITPADAEHYLFTAYRNLH